MTPTARNAFISAAVEAITDPPGLSSQRKAEIKAGLASMPSTFVDAETGAFAFTDTAYGYVKSQGATLAARGVEVSGVVVSPVPNASRKQWPL